MAIIRWKLSPDGASASRTLDSGAIESRLISSIDPAELANALPAYTAAEALLLAKQSAPFKINAECNSAIVAGFTSSALGAVHRYTSTLEDQSNLTSLVLIGADDYYTCTDEVGVKAARLHSIAQLKQVLADGGAEKKKHLSRARFLKEQIDAAMDVAVVEAIVW